MHRYPGYRTEYYVSTQPNLTNYNLSRSLCIVNSQVTSRVPTAHNLLLRAQRGNLGAERGVGQSGEIAGFVKDLASLLAMTNWVRMSPGDRCRLVLIPLPLP